MLLIAAAILVCILTALWIYGRWNFGTLEKLGIPIVEYSNPLLGSTREIYSTVGGLNDVKWLKKYGPIFGVYEGREPQVFICVPELVRLICEKEQDHFNSKRDLQFGDPIFDEVPDFQQDYEKWKLLRSMATPAFTSAKLKLMNLPMREATQDFVKDLKEKIESENGIHEKIAVDVLVHAMLTDLISRCVFSIKINGGTDVNNEFAKLVMGLFTPPTDVVSPELIIWAHTFQFMRKFMPSTVLKMEPIHQFAKILKQMMADRKKSSQKTNDVVDMAMEWWGNLGSPEYNKLKVTEFTLIAQVLTFFIAAQDQISTMVAGVIYHMTQDPQLERRIYEELDRVFAKHNGKIEHEQLNELVLLNSSINECLRLYPFFHRAERVCTKDWENEEYHLKFKKGTIVIFPIWAMNRNPEYNENPEKFDPDRFMPENKDKINIYSSTSFGWGPRNCTGKRFATESMPLILAYLLKELRFIGRKDSEMSFVPGGPHFTPHGPVYVDVVQR